MTNHIRALTQESYTSDSASLAITRAHKQKERFMRQCSDAVSNNEMKRLRGLCLRMITSFHCKLAALDYANKKLNARHRRPLEDLPAIAASLDLRMPSTEIVRVRSKPKKTGGHRFIMSFGLQNRAKQTLVRWALDAFIRGQLRPQQHVLDGGRPAAVRATAAMIEEGKHKHAIELDIKDCFGSIKVEWLKEALPLPPEVIDAVCAAEHLSMVPMDMVTSSHLQSCRKGIPQGSAVSSFLAEFVVASVLSTVPEGVAHQTYVDNVFCSARSKEELRQHYLTLQRCFATHPSGFFAVRASSMQDLRNGFSLLGYQITRRWRKAVIRVSDSCHSAFGLRVERLWEYTEFSAMQRLAVARRLIRSWCGAHSLWWGVRKMERNIRTHIRFLVATTYDASSALMAPPTY